MTITFKGNHKSLTDFTWEDIPAFAIVTGVNGSGKSQLLKLIEQYYLKNPPGTANTYDPKKSSFSISEQFTPHEVTYQDSEWTLKNTNPVSMYMIQQESSQKLSAIAQSQGSVKVRSYFDGVGQRLASEKNKHRHELQLDDIMGMTPDFYEKREELSNQIAKVFMDYLIKRSSTRDKELVRLQKENKTAIDIPNLNYLVEQKIGIAPWKILDEMLIETELPFEFNDPEQTDLDKSFKLKIFKRGTKNEIEFSDLSSGEQVLISLILLLYNTSDKKYHPKLLLLDEPDAHLHPSMTRQFLKVLYDLFVKKYGIRIIMTTHSPSTVALAPAECLFEMSKNEPRIQQVRAVNRTISLLTDGLVIVGKGAKYIFIEGEEDDKMFYESIHKYFIEKSHLTNSLPFIFLPAGSKTVIYNSVPIMNKEMSKSFYGIIDKDNANPPDESVHVLERYSFENYLLDPLLIYAGLVKNNKHTEFPIENLQVQRGEEWKIREQSQEILQRIADGIHRRVEESQQFKNHCVGCSKEKVKVTFINGCELQYPHWLINQRGKTLMNEIYLPLFQGSIIKREFLLASLRTLDFLCIPSELLKIFNKIDSDAN
jgi:AAA15 family ATPase/GTPase